MVPAGLFLKGKDFESRLLERLWPLVLEDFTGNQEPKYAEELDLGTEAEIVTYGESVSQNIEERCLPKLPGSFSAFSSSFLPFVCIDKSHFSQSKDEGK